MKKFLYKKPSRFTHVLSILYVIVTGYVFIYTLKMFAYVIVNYCYPRLLIKVDKSANIHPTVILRHPRNIIIGKGCLINHGNVLQGGKVNAKIRIGCKVHTGPNVMFFAYNHAFDDLEIATIDQGYTENGITIEDDVWIGAGSIILDGVTIGRGSVIGAGSVVTRSFPNHSVISGSPAKLLRRRF